MTEEQLELAIERELFIVWFMLMEASHHSVPCDDLCDRSGRLTSKSFAVCKNNWGRELMDDAQDFLRARWRKRQ